MSKGEEMEILDLNEALRKRRMQLRITQEELANLIGLERHSISQYETGRRRLRRPEERRVRAWILRNGASEIQEQEN